MKKILTTAVLILFFLACSNFGKSDAYLKFPDYNSVVKKFFSSYSINKDENEFLSFEKKKDGWHAVASKYVDGKIAVVHNDLFWSSSKNDFQKIAFPSMKDFDANSNDQRDFLNQVWQAQYFRICPYFGYKGWDKDVMDDFGDKSGLSDSTLYAVGHAYSCYASNLLNNNSGTADEKVQFKLPDGQNCLSEEQLKEYRKYAHLGTETFLKVKAMNPKYETFIGNIDNKIANEYVNAFLTLRIFQNEQEAIKELPDNIYSDFFISMAKNYLQSCDKNAILFVNGDNDTYPLLYVQAKLGWRSDVQVVNLSLLNTDRYINSLRNKILKADGIDFSFTPEQIKGDKREIIYGRKDSKFENSYLNLSDLISFVRDDNNTFENSGANYFYYPTSNFKTSYGLMNDSIKWIFQRQYFLRSDLMVLDIINSSAKSGSEIPTKNSPEGNLIIVRPVYAGITSTLAEDIGLSKYFKLEGMAYRLTSVTNEPTEKLYENIMNIFDWKGVDKAYSTEKSLCSTYRIIFNQLASQLAQENKKEKCEKVLDRSFQIVGNEVLEFDYSVLTSVQTYFLIGKKEKAVEISKKVFGNMQKKIQSAKSEKEKERYNQTIEQLKYVLLENGESEFFNKMKSGK